MQALLNEKSGISTIAKLAIIAFFALSVANLYYNIKVNRKLLEKTS